MSQPNPTTTETTPEGGTPDPTLDNTNPADTQQGQQAGEPESAPNSEAARYRVERNEARAERDTLAGRLGVMQRREAEAAIADMLEVPADLWDLGQAEPADFFSDTDELSSDELRAAAAALLDQRPGLAKTKKFDGPRNWGQSGDLAPASTSSWNEVVKSR
jgi:hypothetical protein